MRRDIVPEKNILRGGGEMKKSIIVVLGTLAILMGLIDCLAGFPGLPLVISGVIGLIIAGILHLRQWWLRKSHTLPLMALVTSPIDEVLTPPDKWPVLQWNPWAVSGGETWMIVLTVMAVVTALGLGAWLVFHKEGR